MATAREKLQAKYGVTPQANAPVVSSARQRLQEKYQQPLPVQKQDVGALGNLTPFSSSEKKQDLREAGSSIMDSLRGTGQRFKDIYQANKTGEQTPVESGIQYAGTALGGAFGAGTQALIGAGKVALPQLAEDAIGGTVKAVANPVIESQPVQSAIGVYESASPRTQRNISAGTEILSTLPIGVAPRVAKTGLKVADDLTEQAIKAFEPTTKSIEKKVIEQFQKGVKPRINAKMTPNQATKFENDIVNAARTIDTNKANLSFVDELGEKITGRNPQTLSELSDALEQTKKQVFSDYDSLAQQAGNEGLKINTNNIAKELDTVISNEALQITNPQAIGYARELKDRLSFRELDASTVQDVIKNYNESLQAFYRNPTYDTASKASIDAMIANQMRQQLDEGITSLTGAQYQSIKNKYGSLKSVEKDIIKAALRDARKNNKGLLDYTDILTGGDIITGLATMNPAVLARGGVSRGIKEFYKYLNSPNRAVKKMFESAERLNQRSIPSSQATPSPKASVIPEGTTRLSPQPSANIPSTPNINDTPKQSNI